MILIFRQAELFGAKHLNQSDACEATHLVAERKTDFYDKSIKNNDFKKIVRNFLYLSASFHVYNNYYKFGDDVDVKNNCFDSGSYNVARSGSLHI